MTEANAFDLAETLPEWKNRFILIKTIFRRACLLSTPFRGKNVSTMSDPCARRCVCIRVVRLTFPNTSSYSPTNSVRLLETNAMVTSDAVTEMIPTCMRECSLSTRPRKRSPSSAPTACTKKLVARK